MCEQCMQWEHYMLTWLASAPPLDPGLAERAIMLTASLADWTCEELARELAQANPSGYVVLPGGRIEYSWSSVRYEVFAAEYLRQRGFTLPDAYLRRIDQPHETLIDIPRAMSLSPTEMIA